MRNPGLPSFRLLLATAVALGALAYPRASHAEATITIVNVDGANEGFNDPTPVAPVGGNTGTTLGQQRLIAFQFAADLFGTIIDSDIEIRIQAAFNPLTCTSTTGVLGSAGTLFINSGAAGQDFPNTWYHVALANKLAGVDTGPASNDIGAQFNSNLGQPGCLDGLFFYLGLDNNPGTDIDLVGTLLHEFAHGLGFANFVNESTGANTASMTDIYSQFTYDETLGVTWATFDPTAAGNAARAASALRCGQISWSGAKTTAAVPGTLNLGAPEVLVTAPAPIAGSYQAGAALFGPALTAGGVSAAVELVNDGSGTTTDGCEALVGFTAGNIALIDRGTCSFTTKVANAQTAGAVAALVADNVAGCPPPGLGGADLSITIPSARITLADGATFKANLPGVVANLRSDTSRRAGASSANRALLYATNPVQSGSSISHWEAAAFPNLLMEPADTGDIDWIANDIDLTLENFQDIGWFKADLSITQSDSADPVVAGTNYSYTLSVNNAGSGTNYPVSVQSTLPVGAGFVSASGTGWGCGHAAGVVTCTRNPQAGADLPNGAAPSIVITVQAPGTPGTVTNTASVIVPSPLIDPAAGNNSDAEDTLITPGGGGGVSITTRTKTVAGDFSPGGTVTYSVTIANSGPGAQGDNAGDEFTDVLPAGVTLVSANATVGSAVASVGTNTVTWNGGLANGGSVVITIEATVDAGNPTGTTISNQGTINFDADGNGTNESSALTDDPGQPGADDPTGFDVGPSIGSYYTVTPCRLVDTRNPNGTYGGPALAAGPPDRTFPIFGQCAIPTSAVAISVNLTVTAPTVAGNVRLYPAGTALPTVSSINYSAGQTRGNNAIVPLSALGELAVYCAQTSGTAHLILDVNGYFE